MRVLIDPQIFLFQQRGGVSRLFSELAKELTATPDVEVVLPFGYVQNEYIARDFPDRMRQVAGGVHRTRPRPLQMLNTLTRMPPRAVDVVHHTWYRPEYIDRYRTRTRVSTVFDMIPEVMPEWSGGDPHVGKREYLEASDAIVCISETTKADLLQHWGDFGKPVHVTYLGVETSFFSPTTPSFALPDRYVLFVGRRADYKNFSLLAEAFADVAGARPDLHLMCVGGGAFGPAEAEFFERHGITDRVHQFAVDDADLPGVYAGARCLVFPSKYEGFGLPILEAYAAGCPVVVADTPCLTEVAGGHATIVSPEDPSELAQALLEISDPDAPDAAVMIGAARDRAAEFTWARTCAETLAIYREITA